MTATPEKIAKAIKYAAFAKRPLTLENVNRYLNSRDKIDQAQLDAHHVAAKGTTPAARAPKPESKAPNATDTDAHDDAPSKIAQLEPPRLSIAAAQARLIESQVALRDASTRVRECRGALAASLARWQLAIGAVVTPEQNARAFIASETQLRADRKAGIAPERWTRRRHRSVIDATAAAYNTGSNRAGGGNAFRRVVKSDTGTWVRPRGMHDVGR